LPGLGIERDQAPVAGARKNLRWRLIVTAPINDAAQRSARRFAEVVLPDLLAGFRLERNDAVMESWRVQDAADHDGDGFRRSQKARGSVEVHVARINVVLPGGAQLGYVAGIDPGERRVALAAGVMAVRRPVRLRIKGGNENACQKDGSKDGHGGYTGEFPALTLGAIANHTAPSVSAGNISWEREEWSKWSGRWSE